MKFTLTYLNNSVFLVKRESFAYLLRMCFLFLFSMAFAKEVRLNGFSIITVNNEDGVFVTVKNDDKGSDIYIQSGLFISIIDDKDTVKFYGGTKKKQMSKISRSFKEFKKLTKNVSGVIYQKIRERKIVVNTFRIPYSEKKILLSNNLNNALFVIPALSVYKILAIVFVERFEFIPFFRNQRNLLLGTLPDFVFLKSEYSFFYRPPPYQSIFN